MRTYNMPSYQRKSKDIPIKPPDMALQSTLIGLNYPCLELIFMVPKVFEPLKFDCIKNWASLLKNILSILGFLHVRLSQGVGDIKQFLAVL